MPDTVQMIQFKSQKDINKERQEMLDEKKADSRRRVEEIKDRYNQRSKRVKVYNER